MYKDDKKRILLTRIFSDEKHTLGILQVIQNGEIIFTCKTVERPWVGNRNGESRVPHGMYQIVLQRSQKFQTSLWELKGVPNRSEAKIHKANYASQLEGCIAVGREFGDINGDGVTDITFSEKTLEKLYYAMAGEKETTINIVDYDI